MKNHKEKWFGLFKTGKHTSMEGTELNVDDAMLDRIISATQSFAYQNDEIPIVIGHPKVDSPKYGSVLKSDVRKNGEEILAKPNYLDESFAELVKDKKYDTVSIQLRKDMSIKHIGFLGATPPAVTGLTPVSFSEPEEGETTLSFAAIQEYELSSWYFNSIAVLLRNIKNMLIEEKGQEAADKILPEYDMSELGKIPNVYPIYRPESSSFAAGVEQGAGAGSGADAGASFAEEKFAELENENKILKDKLAAQELAERRQGFISFCESAEMAKKVTPAIKDKVLTLMEKIDDAGELSFGEGESEVKFIALDEFKNLLKMIPDQVSFSEEFTRTNATEENKGGISDEVKAGHAMAGLVNRK